ncbi:hypothetical protein [Desulfogranum marinum]|uniref:hypothetical protein n=1 Tax=Desulfogranum marinum TaxID=453220 RepID=UPI0029C83FE8|nr:hypothetical protein [Desulfogranum marinum]
MTIKVCCLCNRVERNGIWRYSNRFVEGAVVSHGYCPQCFQETMAEIEKMFAPDLDGSSLQLHHGGCGECV